MEICQIATGKVDAAANQVLRATLNTEPAYGPDWRVTIQPNGTCRILLSQWPILQVLAVQVAPAAQFPPQWTPVTAGLWRVERPPLFVAGTSAANDAGTGGQAVILAPGYVDWRCGRNGYAIEVTYISGWPHAGIAQNVAQAAQSLPVDDCTGWAPATTGGQGATGVIHDTTGGQEAVTATAASVTSGPGTLTLAASLQYAHTAGVLVSTLPDQLKWAAAKFATAQALTRGATATTIQTRAPKGQATASGHRKLEAEACEDVRRFMRVI